MLEDDMLQELRSIDEQLEEVTNLLRMVQENTLHTMQAVERLLEAHKDARCDRLDRSEPPADPQPQVRRKIFTEE